MNPMTADELAGGNRDLAVAIVDLSRVETSALRELASLERRLGAVRRALAVGESASDVYNAGTTLATLMVELGRREVLLDQLNHGNVDLAAVRRAAR